MKEACDRYGPALRASYRVTGTANFTYAGTAPTSYSRLSRARLEHPAHQRAHARTASRVTNRAWFSNLTARALGPPTGKDRPANGTLTALHS